MYLSYYKTKVKQICFCSLVIFVLAISSAILEGNLKRSLLILLSFFILAEFFLCIGVYRSIRSMEKFTKQIINSGGKELLENLEDHADIPKELRDIVSKLKMEIGQQVYNQNLEYQMQYISLQNQINPHFLYNILDSLRGQALVQGNSEIGDMAEKLAKFYRYCISAKGIMVTFREELNNIEDYYFIQKYRFGDRFYIQIDADKVVYDYYLPKLSLQPIVENAINHGLISKRSNGLILIKIWIENKDIYIKIADNGCGMDEQKVNEINKILLEGYAISEGSIGSNGNGIALCNVNNRFKLYFRGEYGIRLHSTLGNGTDVYLFLPMIDYIEVKKIIAVRKEKEWNNERFY